MTLNSPSMISLRNGLPRLLPAFLIALLGCLPATTRAGNAKANTTPAPAPTVTVRAYSGEQDPLDPTGCLYIRFFTPEVGAFLSEVTAPSPVTSASNALNVGGLDSDFPDAVLSHLGQPSGEAVLATFKPGVGGLTANDNVVLLAGDLEGPPTGLAWAQTGVSLDGLPEGVTIKNFLALDGNAYPNTFFLAKLQGTGVTPSNSLALCTFSSDEDDLSLPPDDYDVNVLVRVGDSVIVSGDNHKIVKTITTLTGSKGTLADGRWATEFADQDDDNSIGVLLTFTDGSQGIYLIPEYAIDSYEWLLLPETGVVDDIEGLDGATITSFGLPSFDVDAFAVLANLKIGSVVESGSEETIIHPDTIPNGTVTSSNDVALVVGNYYDDNWSVLTRKGDAVTDDANGNALTGVTIATLSDPVAGHYGSVACMITMAGRPKGSDTGIEYSLYGETPALLANAGAAAPDITGTGTVGNWASFISLVLPHGYEFESGILPQTAARSGASPQGIFEEDTNFGPIFVATLAVNAADDVTTANNLGLWAVNGYGELQLLFRSGQTVTVNDSTKTVRTFVALAAAPGSVGAESGYDFYGDVEVLATFTDGSTALLDIETPGPFELL